jgi:peptidoglycan hydrolase CwlO-like protein
MSIEASIRDLEAKKKLIATAKEEKAKAEGALEPLMEQLKSDFGCDTIEEAKAKFKKTGAEMDVLEEEIEEGTEALNKEMEV